MISCVSGSWGRNPKKKEKRKEQRVKSKGQGSYQGQTQHFLGLKKMDLFSFTFDDICN